MSETLRNDALIVLEQIALVLRYELFRVGDAPISLLSLITAAFIVFMASRMSRLIQRGIRRTLASRDIVDPGTEALVTRTLHYAVMAGGFAVALQALGFDLGSLFAAGAIFAVGIGFAMQNIAQNFVSGVILLVERSIREGDILRVDGKIVRVSHMGIRSTVVRTLDDEEMIVPNATLVQNSVSNLTFGDRRVRVRTTVGVSYDSDLDAVLDVLREVGEAFPGRLPEMKPVVQLRDFADSAVVFQLSIWTEDPWNLDRTTSAIRKQLWDAFKAREIVIAYPQLDVHLDSEVVEGLRRAG